MTEPTENDLETVAISIRMKKGLLDKIDERAKVMKMSRNAWFTHATSYVIEQLPVGADIEDIRKARALWLAGEL